MSKSLFIAVPAAMLIGIAGAHYGTSVAYALPAGTCWEYYYDDLQQIACPDISDIPACQYEDGNPDGMPCLWTSPRTGIAYYNDGSNYHD